ncbi:hypothetical protein ACIOG4_28620 [Streptomyces microflavus]|uniref:hypothetical protein n=1 Tax=Streptomyces microflavus TaxID=1919 RepID=UPI003822667A
MTHSLPSVTALDEAVATARGAARALLPLIAETLHRQFPDGAYLVLDRASDDDDNVLVLNSVRDATGHILRDLTQAWRELDPLPVAPAGLTARWNPLDPREPGALQELIQRIDAIYPYEFFDFLPAEMRTSDEIGAEEDAWGRVPLGIPLRPSQRSASGQQHTHQNTSAS